MKLNKIKSLSRAIPLKILDRRIFLSGNKLNHKQLKEHQTIPSYILKDRQNFLQLQRAAILAECTGEYSLVLMKFRIRSKEKNNIDLGALKCY